MNEPTRPDRPTSDELVDTLRNGGDIIVGWTRPMSETERLDALRAWWAGEVQPLLEAHAWSADIEPDAATIISSCKEALDRSGNMDVVYIHDDPRGPAIAAIVRAGTEPYGDLHSRVSSYPHEILPHDHIEPGMS